MKVNFIPSYNLHSAFTSHYPQSTDKEFDDNALYPRTAYDDRVREAMRSSLYERAGIVIQQYTPVNAESIEDAKIYNFGILPNGAYRGASLANRPECVELLAKSGIYAVIDLDGSLAYEKNCKQNNLEYHYINMRQGFWTNPIFETDKHLLSEQEDLISNFGLTKKEYDKNISEFKEDIKKKRREFMDKFIEITDVINRGHYYAGCELGDYRTSNFLALQYYFNPKWTGPKVDVEPYIFKYCQNMYANLTPEDKTALNMTKEFENKLKLRLELV